MGGWGVWEIRVHGKREVLHAEAVKIIGKCRIPSLGETSACVFNTRSRSNEFLLSGGYQHSLVYSIYEHYLATVVFMTFSPVFRMVILEFLSLLISVLFAAWWWRYWSATGGGRKNLPPGPPGWPVVGNLIQLTLQRRPFMDVVRDLRTKYGPIFTMQMGQRVLIVVTSADLIHEALVQRGPAFAGRPPDSPIRLLFSAGNFTINSSEYGPLWRALRRNFVTELINPARIRQCSWIRESAIDGHIARIRRECEGTGSVRVMSNCRLTVCSILVFLCFGARVSEDEVVQIETVLKEVMMMTIPKVHDYMPILRVIFRRQMEEAKAVRRKQLDSLLPLVRRRRSFAGGVTGENDGMVSPLGAAYVDSLFTLNISGHRHLGDDELVALCSEVMNAGTDTTATVLEWALLHVVVDQKLQEKLYQEIVDHVGRDGMIADEDVERMSYLGAIVKETLRRHPPSHFVLSHTAIRDTQLGGYTIPAGVNVEFYTAWITENPAVWEDPSEFRPERFLDGDGKDVDMTGTKELKMMPFGAGRRICPAWTLGVLHVQLLLARMVQAFRWLPVAGAPPDPTETFAFTVVMKHPLRAVIVPR